MGILRLLLALAVVAFHSVSSAGWPALWDAAPNGIVAVQAFFCISGFYMALILSTKYADRALVFYETRLLRIWPVYWVVLLITIFTIPQPAVEPGLRGVFTILSNSTFLGLDWSAAFDLGSVIVPPAWTLGTELTFYLLAPFINKLRSRWLIAMLIASVVARSILYSYGFNSDPWLYRIFPLELAWFLSGMLAYRFYASHSDRTYMHPAGVFAMCLMLASIAFYRELWTPVFDVVVPIVVRHPWMQFAFDQTAGEGQLTKLLMPIALPFIFAFSRNLKVDGIIGELSYPIYMCHFLVLKLMQQHKIASGPILITSTLILASFLLFVTNPIERYRSNRGRK